MTGSSRRHRFPGIAAGVVAALALGAAPAAAQAAPDSPNVPPGAVQMIPGVPDLSGVLPGLPESRGEMVKLGRASGRFFGPEIYGADLGKQVVAGQKVLPGGLVHVRLNVDEAVNEPRVRELRSIMPAEFELVSVIRMRDTALGEAAHVLSPDEYEVLDAEDGMREVKVAWTVDGLLGLYRDNPTVRAGESLAVDFIYRAPAEPGEYGHGGSVIIGDVFNLWKPRAENRTGALPIEVGPGNVFGSLDGYTGGSR